MQSNKRKTYSKEFKINAVRMIIDNGQRASEVSRNLDISSNLLYGWKQAYLEDNKDSFPGNGNLKPQDEYIRKLELENKTLKAERDILKKAAIFFAKEP